MKLVCLKSRSAPLERPAIPDLDGLYDEPPEPPWFSSSPLAAYPPQTPGGLVGVMPMDAPSGTVFCMDLRGLRSSTDK